MVVKRECGVDGWWCMGRARRSLWPRWWWSSGEGWWFLAMVAVVHLMHNGNSCSSKYGRRGWWSGLEWKSDLHGEKQAKEREQRNMVVVRRHPEAVGGGTNTTIFELKDLENR